MIDKHATLRITALGIMNRKDLKLIAATRAKEARVLLDNGCFDGAYYLIGYAVECALKACIAKQTRRYDFPDKRTANQSFTHNLADLVKTAGLQGDLDLESRRDRVFSENWGKTKDWSEDSRYRRWTKAFASDLYGAVTDADHGVLKWVKQHW